jgi:hypothetical protein
MKNPRFMLFVLVALTALVFGPGMIQAREPAPAASVPVHVVVTAEPRHGSDVPPINRDDVAVYQGREHLQVTDWLPLQGEHAGLQLFIVLDDASNTSIGSQYEDIRRFILAQPESTAIGLGYMRDGTVDIARDLTNDHAAAAKALRLPLGNIGAFSSIYLSISDLIKRWPKSPVRREMLVITDGIDQFGGPGPANPYVDSVVDDAQREGVIIYSIYARGVGHFAHNGWSLFWGQNYLSRIAQETGGEAFYLGYETPVSFTPYLDDITRRLNHQYLLTFLAKPEKKPGFQRVRVRTEVPNVELVAASRVYVPAE